MLLLSPTPVSCSCFLPRMLGEKKIPESATILHSGNKDEDKTNVVKTVRVMGEAQALERAAEMLSQSCWRLWALINLNAAPPHPQKRPDLSPLLLGGDL